MNWTQPDTNILKVRYMTKDKPNGVCVNYKIEGRIEPLDPIVIHTETSVEKMCNKDLTDISNNITASKIRAGTKTIDIPAIPERVFEPHVLSITDDGPEWIRVQQADDRISVINERILGLENHVKESRSDVRNDTITDRLSRLDTRIDFIETRINSIEQRFMDRIEYLESIIGDFRDTEEYSETDDMTIDKDTISELRVSTAKDIIKKGRPILVNGGVSVNGSISQLVGALCKINSNSKDK